MDKSASAKKELIVKIELFVILPGLGVDRKCRHGSLPAARRAIPENICSSRAFLRLTRSGHLNRLDQFRDRISYRRRTWDVNRYCGRRRKKIHGKLNICAFFYWQFPQRTYTGNVSFTLQKASWPK